MRRINPDSLFISTLFEQALIRRFDGRNPISATEYASSENDRKPLEFSRPKLKFIIMTCPLSAQKKPVYTTPAETILRTVKTSSMPLRPKRVKMCKTPDLSYF